ncbi:ribonuclease H-like domain-containing protein [bacterium]|nr:ribonuclease H-like domain-containing protein [bacterium]
MSLADDRALREVLEGLTRLRLAHDRFATESERRDLPPLRPMIVPAPVESSTLEVAVGAEEARRSRGRYLRRDVSVERALPHLAGLADALRDAQPEAGRLVDLVADIDLLAQASAEDLLFLDLETTGLHRGLIVLLGFMTVGPGERPLTATQLFARDHDEEAPMLEEFMEVLRARPILVSFNGRSFDAPYLESRLRFHGFFEPLRFAHVDLLHLARRLWSAKLPNCRLVTLEKCLFGRRRVEDLPGSEVPRVWEDYVRHNDLRDLPGIWEHNLRDLATLAELIVRAAKGEEG